MNDTLQAPADAPPPNKRKLGIALALVLAIVVVVGLWLAWRSPAEQLQGMADADTVNVAAKITARLAELKVREGDRVKAGQVLFVLDSPEVAAKEEQAQGALEAASAVADKADAGARSEDIRAAQANWKRAEAGATLADATYQRVQNLFNEGVMTRQKRDEALAQARSSRELSNAARAQYDQALAGAREQDKRAAQGQSAVHAARWPKWTPRVRRSTAARRWPARSTSAWPMWANWSRRATRCSPWSTSTACGYR